MYLGQLLQAHFRSPLHFQEYCMNVSILSCALQYTLTHLNTFFVNTAPEYLAVNTYFPELFIFLMEQKYPLSNIGHLLY